MEPAEEVRMAKAAAKKVHRFSVCGIEVTDAVRSDHVAFTGGVFGCCGEATVGCALDF